MGKKKGRYCKSLRWIDSHQGSNDRGNGIKSWMLTYVSRWLVSQNKCPSKKLKPIMRGKAKNHKSMHELCCKIFCKLTPKFRCIAYKGMFKVKPI